MKRLVFLAALSALLLSCGKAGISPAGLRCEYAVDPVVVPSSSPRLSWINEATDADARDECQSAYRILAATSPALLEEGKADLWDSGKQPSGESHLVAYGGLTPEPMTTCYWKVMTWDGSDRASGWSAPASWGTGPEEGGWDAGWIGAPWQEDTPGQWYTRYPMFRKEFDVAPGLREAKLFISGLGFCESSLNGEKVGDGFFSPGFTDYTSRPGLAVHPRIPLSPEVTFHRTLYNGYDVTALLQEGPNAIGVILGNGYFHTAPSDMDHQCESFGVPRLICRLELFYEDGRRESLCSDTSWKSAPSPFVFGDIWAGEVYDAREEQEGWNEAGFDDSAWEYAVPRNAPDGALEAQPGPTDRITESFSPVSFERLDDGSYKVDFGTVISGRVHFKGIRGKAGEILKVRYISEYPSPRCEYVFAGDETVDWAPRFTWFVFREAVISGIGELSGDQLLAEAINTDVPLNAEFHCSNPLFEQILDIFRRSQMDNMHAGVASDCPHRERLPYTGDAEIAINAVMSSFAADGFYSKWIEDILGSQQKDGYVPNGVPWEPMCGGGIPWGAAICVMPWEFYLQYGDRDLLSRSLEGMKAYVGYLGGWTLPDGTIHVQRPTPDGKPYYWYNLGEWAPAFRNPEDALVHTFYYWLCARNTAEAARVLGDKEAAARYSALCERIRAAFHGHFYDPGTKSYGDFGSNVFALYMGVPETCLEDVRATLREELGVKYGGHLNTGFIASRFLFETLSLNGLGDLAYTIMNQRDYPSFGWWIEQGATTSWEHWDGTESRNHPMFGGGLTWFSRILAGVDTDPDAPGFRHVIIRPVPVPELESVSYSTMTPYGRVSSSLSHEGTGRVRLEVEIPVGSRATVYVPETVEAASARPWDDASYRRVEVGSGKYSF